MKVELNVEELKYLQRRRDKLARTNKETVANTLKEYPDDKAVLKTIVTNKSLALLMENSLDERANICETSFKYQVPDLKKELSKLKIHPSNYQDVKIVRYLFCPGQVEAYKQCHFKDKFVDTFYEKIQSCGPEFTQFSYLPPHIAILLYCLQNKVIGYKMWSRGDIANINSPDLDNHSYFGASFLDAYKHKNLFTKFKSAVCHQLVAENSSASNRIDWIKRDLQFQEKRYAYRVEVYNALLKIETSPANSAKDDSNK